MKTSLHFVVPNIKFNKNVTKLDILLKQRLYEYTDCSKVRDCRKTPHTHLHLIG